jgi:hypothetical protein
MMAAGTNRTNSIRTNTSPLDLHICAINRSSFLRVANQEGRPTMYRIGADFEAKNRGYP